MNLLPAQNTTSISRPIEPIDRGLSDAVASILNTVEVVNGQALATRLPGHELRVAISARLVAVRQALAPLGRAMAEKDRAANAVIAMLTGWINAKVADPRAKVAGYVTILADLPCWVVEEVCRDAGSGRIAGLEAAYPPSAAQLHQLCEERLERLRKEQSDLLTAGAVKLAATPAPTEAERQRIGLQLVDLRERLRHGDDHEVESRLLVKAEQNSAELARQQDRVRAEFRAAGLNPPQDLRFALSITAIRDMQSRGMLPIDNCRDAES